MTAPWSKLTSRVAALGITGVGRSVVVNGVREYARDSVAGAAVCLAGRVGTYLSALGAALEGGADLSEAVATRVSDCVMGAIAPVPPSTCPICGGNSFATGTEVLTPDGKVAIEELREGDMVIARDEETGLSGTFPITVIMQSQSTAVRWLVLEDALGRTSRPGLTGGHPMFVVGQGWLTAEEVAPGDAIRNAGLRELTVLAVEVDDRPQLVHNLETAEAHTYFAGELEAWGHNARWRGRGNYIRQIIACPNTPKAQKGWIKTKLRHRKSNGKKRYSPSNVPNEKGFDEGHPLGQTRKNGVCLTPNSVRRELARDNRSRGGKYRGDF